MTILIIGTDIHQQECIRKLGPSHTYQLAANYPQAEQAVAQAQLIFDFLLEHQNQPVSFYKTERMTPVLISAVFVTLKELVHKHSIKAPLVVGVNGLPGFIDRPALEVSFLNSEDENRFKELAHLINTSYYKVEDRVGMVTPRVIGMIINEAFLTVEEGTASREDIDVAMKLGTNYPYGPFEWAQRIGLTNVVRVLDAVHHDTKEERYQVCTLMRQEAETR